MSGNSNIKQTLLALYLVGLIVSINCEKEDIKNADSFPETKVLHQVTSSTSKISFVATEQVTNIV